MSYYGNGINERHAGPDLGRMKPNWTHDEHGNSNSSPEFDKLCNEVERLIRSDAHSLINGHAHRTARLIMAQLAHVHGLVPTA